MSVGTKRGNTDRPLMPISKGLVERGHSATKAYLQGADRGGCGACVSVLHNNACVIKIWYAGYISFVW